jgi:hypothetical protein
LKKRGKCHERAVSGELLASIELENPSFRYEKKKNCISMSNKISVHFLGLNPDLLKGVDPQKNPYQEINTEFLIIGQNLIHM